MLEGFGRFAAGMRYAKPRIRLISNVSGETLESADAEYWVKHVRRRCNSGGACRRWRRRTARCWWRSGQGRRCWGWGSSAWRRKAGGGCRLCGAAGRIGKACWRVLGRCTWRAARWIGRHSTGPMGAAAFRSRPIRSSANAIGTRPVSPTRESSSEFSRRTSHAFLGARLLSPAAIPQFASEFSIASLPLVRDHRVQGMPWVNLVIYLEMAAAALREMQGAGPLVLSGVTVPHGLILPEQGVRRVVLTLEPVDSGAFAFRVSSMLADSAWALHAAGTVSVNEADTSSSVSIEELQARCTRELSPGEFYSLMERHGVRLGPTCRWLAGVWRGNGEALGRLRPPQSSAENDSACVLHLGAVDSCFQLFGALLESDGPHDYMFSGLDRMQWYGTPQTAVLWCHAVLDSLDVETGTLTGHVRILDDRGAVVAEVAGARLERVAMAAAGAAARIREETRGDSGAAALRETLRNAPLPDRLSACTTYILERLASTLRVPVNSLQADAPLSSQVDSLMAVELKTRIESDLEVSVPIAVFFDGKSAAELAQVLLQEAAPEAPAMTVAEMEAERCCRKRSPPLLHPHGHPIRTQSS